MRRFRVLAAILGTLLLPACTTMTGRTATQNADDALTTAAVKTRLADEKLSTLTGIDVDTNQGIVTLNGTVGSEATRLRVGEITRRVGGVRGVMNNLRVSTPTYSDAEPASRSGTLVEREGRWRAVDTNLEGRLADIRARATREAALQNRAVAYESVDGVQRVEAHPLANPGPNGCRQVQERVFQNGRLVSDRSAEVCG